MELADWAERWRALSEQVLEEMQAWRVAHPRATLREIELDATIQSRYPVLSRGAAEVGSVQIRNLATLGGNMANASPSADTSPSFVTVRSRSTRSTV